MLPQITQIKIINIIRKEKFSQIPFCLQKGFCVNYYRKRLIKIQSSESVATPNH